MNVNIARNLPYTTTPSPQYFQSRMVGHWIQKRLVLVLSLVPDSYSHSMSGNFWAKKKVLQRYYGVGMRLGSTIDT